MSPALTGLTWAVILIYGLLPLWVLAGLADWWLHRRSSIESTSGTRESAFHLALFAQMGLGALAAMVLQVNAGLLAMLAALVLLAVSQQGPADWDVRLKDEPLPAAYLLGACAAIGLFNLVPLLEEAWRCARTAQRKSPLPDR